MYKVRFFVKVVLVATFIVDLISADPQECFSESFSLDILDGHLVDLLFERFVLDFLLGGGERGEIAVFQIGGHVSYIFKIIKRPAFDHFSSNPSSDLHCFFVIKITIIWILSNKPNYQNHFNLFMRYSLILGLKKLMSYSNHTIIGWMSPSKKIVVNPIPQTFNLNLIFFLKRACCLCSLSLSYLAKVKV